MVLYAQNLMGSLELADVLISNQFGLVNTFITEGLAQNYLEYSDNSGPDPDETITKRVNHYQVSPMFNIDWESSQLKEFYFNNKLENIIFMKHFKYAGKKSDSISLMFYVKE